MQLNFLNETDGQKDAAKREKRLVHCKAIRNTRSGEIDKR